jgi:hypothetical protein
MKSYLMSQGYWCITNGTNTKLPQLAVGAAKYDDREEARNQWDRDDDAAIGTINLRTSASLHNIGAAATSSKDLWDLLLANLGTPGPALIWQDFRTATTTRISMNNPVNDINKVATSLGRLATNGMTLPPLIQGMILLAAIPREHDHLAAAILQGEKTTTLTFAVVRDAIVADAQRRSAMSSRQPLQANKISAVKRKGANPKWQPQASGSGNQAERPPNADKKGKRQTPRGKRAGKNVSKNQHSHLASMAHVDLVAPNPAPITTVTGSGKIIKPMLEQCLTTALMVPNPLPTPVVTLSTCNP